MVMLRCMIDQPPCDAIRRHTENMMTEHTMIFQSKAEALSQAVSQSNLSEFA